MLYRIGKGIVEGRELEGVNDCEKILQKMKRYQCRLRLGNISEKAVGKAKILS